MKTTKTICKATATKIADIGKYLALISLVFGALCINAQSRIGSGDQGIQGLLAATTRQIIPGSDVVVDVPDVNNNEKILVTADGPITTGQKEDKYCVVLIKKSAFGSVNFDTKNDYRICADVGTPVYVKGNFKIAIQFSNSLAFFEKKDDEALVVKLGKIQIPKNNNLSYSKVTRDLTNQDELNKLLYTTWLSDINMSEYECVETLNKEDCANYFSGDFSVFKRYLTTLPDQNVQLFGITFEKIISAVGPEGGVVYALPGVYKITWFYKGSNAQQVTSGIVLK